MKKIINQLKHNVAMSNDLAFSLNASMNKPCWRLFIRLMDAVRKDDTEFIESTFKKNIVFQSNHSKKRQMDILCEWLDSKVIRIEEEKKVGVPIFEVVTIDSDNKVEAKLNRELEKFLLCLNNDKGFTQIRSDLLMRAVDYSALIVPLFINIYSLYMKRTSKTGGAYTLFMGYDTLMQRQMKSYKKWKNFNSKILKPTLAFCKSIGWDVSSELDLKKRVVNIKCEEFPIDLLQYEQGDTVIY